MTSPALLRRSPRSCVAVAGGRHAHDAAEVSGELALIVETHTRRQLGGAHARGEQLLGALDAELGEVRLEQPRGPRRVWPQRLRRPVLIGRF